MEASLDGHLRPHPQSALGHNTEALGPAPTPGTHHFRHLD